MKWIVLESNKFYVNHWHAQFTLKQLNSKKTISLNWKSHFSVCEKKQFQKDWKKVINWLLLI